MAASNDTDVPIDSLAYEDFVARSFEALQLTGIGKLTQHRHFRGKSGHNHQIDIAIEITIAGLDLLVLVECKCYRRSVEVSDVLEFVTRLQDIGAHKGAMVTTVGFQEGAVLLAKAHRIALLITAPKKEIKVAIGASANLIVGRRIVIDSKTKQPKLEPDVRAQLPVFPTSIAWYPSHSTPLSFREAWGVILASLFRGLILNEVRDGRIHVDARCPDCSAVITKFIHGCCRSCRQPLRVDSPEIPTWIQCSCGKRAHWTELDMIVGVCRCGSPRSALSLPALQDKELRKLFRKLKIDVAW